MIKVMIADDHEMVREGLKELIEFNGDIQVVGEAGDGYECLNQIRVLKPDILLLDINMPDLNGIETLQKLNERKRRPKVLILTVHNEIEYLVQAVDLGVDGYILKDSGSSELIRAIHFLYNGDQFIQPSMIPLLNSKLFARDIDKDKLAMLSEREMQILKLVASGHLNKDIGETLCISEQTVKNHLFNIYKKIGCTDRTQAAVFCIRNGLVTI